MVGLQCLFLDSTYACTHQWAALGWCLGIAGICGAGLYLVLYEHLPDENEGVEARPAE